MQVNERDFSLYLQLPIGIKINVMCCADAAAVPDMKTF